MRTILDLIQNDLLLIVYKMVWMGNMDQILLCLKVVFAPHSFGSIGYGFNYRDLNNVFDCAYYDSDILRPWDTQLPVGPLPKRYIYSSGLLSSKGYFNDR